MNNRASNPRKAEVYFKIDKNCRFCLYDPGADGTWREQVEACTSPDCALYPIRPVSRNHVRVRRKTPDPLQHHPQPEAQRSPEAPPDR